jgi:glycosyltransferase involved in cell wall biosynthesis
MFEPGNADSLAHQLQRMLTEPGLAERCQRAGEALVHDVYSWDAVAAATVPLYESVVPRAEARLNAP